MKNRLTAKAPVPATAMMPMMGYAPASPSQISLVLLGLKTPLTAVEVDSCLAD